MFWNHVFHKIIQPKNTPNIIQVSQIRCSSRMGCQSGAARRGKEWQTPTWLRWIIFPQNTQHASDKIKVWSTTVTWKVGNYILHMGNGWQGWMLAFLFGKSVWEFVYTCKPVHVCFHIQVYVYFIYAVIPQWTLCACYRILASWLVCVENLPSVVPPDFVDRVGGV